jgi:hypothetical protein
MSKENLKISEPMAENPLLSAAFSLISDFMELELSKGIQGDTDIYYKIPYYHDSLIASKRQFLFHVSWDWFMPVYKKFSSLQGQPMPSFMIHYRNISAWVERVNIEEAFRCLADAIKWYNDNAGSDR